MSLKLKHDALLVLVMLALTYGYFYQDASWNGNSRIGLIFAAVQEGRLTIDSFHTRPGTQTGDKSFYKGHYYSDKAIGTSVVGAIVYLPMYWLMRLFNHQLSVGLVKYLLTFLVIGLSSAFAGGLMYTACKFITANQFRAFVATAAIALGTMSLPYSTLFYGHQLAASFLFCAFFLILQVKSQPDLSTKSRLFLIGLLLGLALITEYTTIVIILLLVAYYFHVLWYTKLLRRTAAAAMPVVGGLIPIAILLIYNTLCFDRPFSIGYQYLSDQSFRESMGQGLMGIQWPSPMVLYYLTVHPAHGLFWQAPVLIMAVIGLYFMFRDKNYRVEAIVSTIAFAVYLLINSGYYLWWGGWAFGPRHLIPMLPFLCLPLLFVPRRLFLLVVVLGLISVFQMLVVVATVAQVPDDTITKIGKLSYFQYSSIYSYCWRKLLEGELTWNLGQQLFGLKAWTSLLPIILVWLGITSIFARLRSNEASPSTLNRTAAGIDWT